MKESQAAPEPNTDLKRLERLISTWKVTGDTQG